MVKKRLYTAFMIIGVGVAVLGILSVLGVRAVGDGDAAFTAPVVMLAIASVSVVLLIIVWAVAAFAVGGIAKPLEQLTKEADRMALGDMNAFAELEAETEREDEIYELSRRLYSVAESFRALQNDIDKMCVERGKIGDSAAKLPAAQYKGNLRETAESINALTDSFNRDIESVTDVMKRYANGDFGRGIGQLPGKRAVLSNAVNELQATLNATTDDIKRLLNEAAKGRFGERSGKTGYTQKGEWREIGLSLNKLLDNAQDSIKDATEICAKMENGSFRASHTRRHEGEFLVLANAANSASASLAKQINDISNTLSSIAAKNYRPAITGDYKGDFAPIRQSLLTIVDSNAVGGANNILPMPRSSPVSRSSTLPAAPKSTAARPQPEKRTVLSPGLPPKTPVTSIAERPKFEQPQTQKTRSVAQRNQLSGASSVKLTAADSAKYQAIYESKDFGKYS